MEWTVLQCFPSLELRPEQAAEKAWIRPPLSRFFPSERWGWVRAASSPGSLSYPSRSVGTGTREPWERGWSAGSFFPKSVCELVSHPDVLGGSSCVLVPRTGSGGGDEPNERPSRRLLGIETIQWIIARLIGQSKRVLIEICNKKWYKADDVLQRVLKNKCHDSVSDVKMWHLLELKWRWPT